MVSPYKWLFIWVQVSIFVGSISASSIAIAAAGTTSSNVKFSATFVGGSCEIVVPSSLQFNGGNMLMPADIKQQLPSTIQTFNLILNNCSGFGFAPMISVSGASTTDFGSALFRNIPVATDANGYGVLLSTVGNRSFMANSNLAEHNNIVAKDWNANMQLSSIDATIPMSAVLTCGDCNYSGKRGGDFNATVTFDFVYE